MSARGLGGPVGKATALAVVLCAFVFVAVWWRTGGEEQVPAPLAQRVEVAARAVSAVAPAHRREPEPVAAPVPAAQAASAARALDKIMNSGRMICGFGRVPPSTDADAAAHDLKASPAVLAARQRLDATLRASADPFAQAVATWLDPAQTLNAPGEREDLLARQALAGGDPNVYGLAFRACQPITDPGSACAGLSARGWAQADSANGLPWLYVLEEATARGDVAAQEDALTRLSLALRVEDRAFGAMRPIADAAADDDLGLMMAYNLAVQAFGLHAGQARPQAPLFAACSDAAADPNRAATCARVADVLIDRSDAPWLRAVGGKIDFMLTGDPERQARVEAEQGAGWSLFGLSASQACPQVRKNLETLRRVGEIGEVAALRERRQAAAPP